MFFESMMPSNHLILCHLLLLLPSISPSIRVFSNESALFTSGDQSIGASASVFPVNIQGWFPLGLASLILQSKVLFKSLPQHHNLKASTLWCSTFVMDKLSLLVSFYFSLSCPFSPFYCWRAPTLPSFGTFFLTTLWDFISGQYLLRWFRIASPCDIENTLGIITETAGSLVECLCNKLSPYFATFLGLKFKS